EAGALPLERSCADFRWCAACAFVDGARRCGTGRDRRSRLVTPTQSALPTDSLGYAMLHAARAALSVRHGRSLGDALIQERKAAERAATRGAIQDIAYYAMRVRGAAEAIVDAFCGRVAEPELLRELLCVAVGLLDTPLRLEAAPHYADFTVVAQAVAAAAADARLLRARGLVNAVLRNVVREPSRVHDVLEANETARLNYPGWWINRLRSAYPDQWREILASGQGPAPMSLRVNRRRTTPAAYLELLSGRGLEGTVIGPDAVRLGRPRPVHEVPGFEEGMVSVQDDAAQRAASLC